MRFIIVILVLCALLTATPSNAGTAEVRDVAIGNNCPPKKIEVYKQALGGGDGITYRVQCVMPKVVNPDAAAAADKPPDALLIACNQSMCNMLRPVSSDKK